MTYGQPGPPAGRCAHSALDLGARGPVMAVPAGSVSPYWELTFDADGDVDGPERDRLLADVARHGVRDLLVFAHGWNNERTVATRLYSSFFAPVPSLAPRARLGYVGVIWPSMMFAD